MDWCNAYLTPQALSKYIYLSPPLFLPTTSTELEQKTARWITPGSAPLRIWMHEIFFLSDILFTSCYFTCTCLVLEISLFGSIAAHIVVKVFHIWHSDPYMVIRNKCHNTCFYLHDRFRIRKLFLVRHDTLRRLSWWAEPIHIWIWMPRCSG
jgi:hypothetical protein